MNVRIVVLVALVVVLAGCLGWEPAQGQGDPIVDVKTDEGSLDYDDRTPDISGIDNSPPSPVSGVDEPTPRATETPAATPNGTDAPSTPSGTADDGTSVTPAGTDATAGTDTAVTESATGTQVETGTENVTGTPVETATSTDVPAGDSPTAASTDEE